MKYKLVALDLDDSFLCDDRTIHPENLKAVEMMESMGVKIVLCSGRAFDSMKPFVDLLGIHQEDDMIISFNGAMINRINGEEIFKRIVEGDVLEAIIRKGREHQITTQLYGDGFYVEKATSYAMDYERFSGLEMHVVEDLTSIDHSVKVLFNHTPGSKLESLRLDLLENFSEEMNIFYSKASYIEVLNKEADKGKAVAYVAKVFGIDQSEVLTMGDGFNDISMLEYAGIGVVVANAHDDVKIHADYVTNRTNNEGALFEVFQKFFSAN